jgi:hydrogenase-4 component E
LTVVAWACVGCALAVVFVRRRSTAIALVTLQSLLLAGVAFARSAGDGKALLDGGALLVKALALGALLLWSVQRTREPSPIVNGISPLVRVATSVALALVAVAAIPDVAPGAASVEHAAVALVAIGIATSALRRATLHQALGLLVAENGIATFATGIAGGIPLLVELGAVFDLMVIVAVALVFHDRIFGAFGTGDAALLGSLRD